MPMVKVNDVELNYKLEGEGPETIVLINGLADDLETWLEQVPDFFAAGYRVLRFDNRGIGKSGRPKGPYTTAMMAKDAKALVDHLKIRDFHLVGVSMGGMISQEYALAYQGDLRSLTLCCTYAAPGPFCARMFKLWQDMAPVMGVPAVMRDVTLWAFTQEFFLMREGTLREFEAAMAGLDQPVEAYLAQLNSIQTHDTRSRLKTIKVPTLVLAGADDILIPMNLSRELHTLIPDAEWATSIGGHAFLWEHPGPFNQAVLGFVGKHRRSAK
ncbi:MAG TPA: alpha/beta fold hydrolase [Dongiaceae bacterium]|jgi:3-oxoadipate enol-lactonase|nr:alpha/beta fold hydrolase [Dongiaceae bacterium]HSE75740.1 alpha/beta fold hydrolase [Dongiaceae bacterium]